VRVRVCVRVRACVRVRVRVRMCHTGHSGIVFSLEAAGGFGSAAACTVAAVGWQLVLEYYWHRMMHLPFFYRRFHKVLSLCIILQHSASHCNTLHRTATHFRVPLAPHDASACF